MKSIQVGALFYPRGLSSLHTACIWTQLRKSSIFFRNSYHNLDRVHELAQFLQFADCSGKKLLPFQDNQRQVMGKVVFLIPIFEGGFMETYYWTVAEHTN